MPSSTLGSRLEWAAPGSSVHAWEAAAEVRVAFNSSVTAAADNGSANMVRNRTRRRCSDVGCWKHAAPYTPLSAEAGREAPPEWLR